MQFMWADTLEAMERAHLLRLIVWGAASIVSGSAILAWLNVGRRASDLLRHFAYQCAAWGIVEVVVGGMLAAQVETRDLAAATRLDRLLWLTIGLSAGSVATGLTLAIAGWRLRQSFSAVGAGMGIVVHGLALAVLDLVLAGQISR